MSNQECNECKNKGYSKMQIFTMVVGVYILFSAIYGTVKLLELLF